MRQRHGHHQDWILRGASKKDNKSQKSMPKDQETARLRTQEKGRVDRDQSNKKNIVPPIGNNQLMNPAIDLSLRTIKKAVTTALEVNNASLLDSASEPLRQEKVKVRHSSVTVYHQDHLMGRAQLGKYCFDVNEIDENRYWSIPKKCGSYQSEGDRILEKLKHTLARP